MAAASNTHDCFRELIGRKVAGVMFDVMPPHRRDLSAGTKTLILDDGTGLTVAANGSYWRENLDDMRRAVDEERARLKRLTNEMRELLVADGLLASEEA